LSAAVSDPSTLRQKTDDTFVSSIFTLINGQSDQIGQTFAQWVSTYIFTLGSFLKIAEVALKLGLLFPTV
jgi:hypothetical protein